jgi:ATP-dependent DNA helicase RecG
MEFSRLLKALQVEADDGFNDMQGKQYRFSEFLCLSHPRNPPRSPPTTA